MRIPYLNLPAQYWKQKKELDETFKRVMSEGSFILRKDVEEFEEKMASYVGTKYAIGVNSGTDALFLALNSLNLNPEDEVITTAILPYSTFATLNVGAKPILVNIDNDFNMDVDEIEGAITSNTKAIIPVHLNGRASRMDEIMRISTEYNIPIIEDSAQSLGSEYQGRKTGSFGLLGCFSVHPMKNLSCAGDGGFITTSDSTLEKKIKSLRNLGKEDRTVFKEIGFNSRLDNLQAALLNVKFKNFERYINRRRGVAKEYNKGLFGLPLILPPISKDDTYNSYVVRTREQEGFFKHLRDNDIEAFLHYNTPVHKMKGLNLQGYNLPMTERICSEAVSLPINPSMTKSQINYVIEKSKEYFK